MTASAEDNALQTWVVRASGLAADKVLWDVQNMPRPLDDFITLRQGDQSTLGAFDQIVELQDLTRPAGQEIELRVEGWREFTLTVQAFTHATEGDTCAREVLTRVQTYLGLPSIRELLGTVNLGPSFERGVVQNLPQLLGTSRFESRAVVSINFYRLVTASDYVGYVAEVKGSGSITSGLVNLSSGSPGTIALSLDIDVDAG